MVAGLNGEDRGIERFDAGHCRRARVVAFGQTGALRRRHEPNSVTCSTALSYSTAALYSSAIRSMRGRSVRHRTDVYVNNRLEQDHRGNKELMQCVRGFNGHDATGRCCREHDEFRNVRRSRPCHNQDISGTRSVDHYRWSQLVYSISSPWDLKGGALRGM